jgi:hypothetical protein
MTCMRMMTDRMQTALPASHPRLRAENLIDTRNHESTSPPQASLAQITSAKLGIVKKVR